jgi:TusA-related sulfurtransferase
MVDHDADLVVLQEGLLVFAVKAVARAGPKKEGEILEVEAKAEEAHKNLKEFHEQLSNVVRELNEYQRTFA